MSQWHGCLVSASLEVQCLPALKTSLPLKCHNGQLKVTSMSQVGPTGNASLWGTAPASVTTGIRSLELRTHFSAPCGFAFAAQLRLTSPTDRRCQGAGWISQTSRSGTYLHSRITHVAIGGFQTSRSVVWDLSPYPSAILSSDGDEAVEPHEQRRKRSKLWSSAIEVQNAINANN